MTVWPTEPAGEAVADGEGLPGAVELELPPGSIAQPAATTDRAIISPRAVSLIVFILQYLVTDVTNVGVVGVTRPHFTSTYFVPDALAFGEGDAAGDGLAGLEVVAGVFSIAAAGEADGEGLAAAGEFELLAGSVAQPAANTIENIVRSRSAVRLMMLMFAVLISFCLVSARLKARR